MCLRRCRRGSAVAAAVLLGAVGLGVQGSAQTTKVTSSYADVAPLLSQLAGALPAELLGRTRAELELAWPAWVSSRRLQQQQRLDQGDEDSLVNLWLFGTSFTRYPPLRPRDIERAGSDMSMSQLADARLDDLIAGMVTPGANERLQSARAFLERRGMDVTVGVGQTAARRLLVNARTRGAAEFQRTDAELRSARGGGDPAVWWVARSTVFRDRGLSSDTSLLVNYAIDQALEALASNGVLSSGAVRRVALVGPGLDFINKADGHDFYPEQSIQPFALADSLVRLGLSTQPPHVATLDVNPRVNAHLVRARHRAEAGDGYVLHALLSAQETWTPALREYWQRFGGRIGLAVQSARAPFDSEVRVRAVRVKPEFVSTLEPHDLDVVLERLDVAASEQRFDLVVATNVLVYYAPFEQALALANIGAMLRPGGIVLTNDYVRPTSAFEPSIAQVPVAYSRLQDDVVFAYRRR